MPKNNEAIQPKDNENKLQESELTNAVFLERYKYVLQEIHTLNNNIHKYLNLFQTLATALATAGVAVFVGRQQLDLTSDVARTAIQGLMGLLIVLAAFVVLAILAGVFSWLDYRAEEVELLNKLMGYGFRKPPKKRNFWRWQETYVVIFILIVVTSIILYVQNRIIPLL